MPGPSWQYSSGWRKLGRKIGVTRAETADAVIIGGGIIGASIGYYLQRAEPSWRVVILEAADQPGSGETRWATGGIRHQFGTEPNIRLSLLSTPTFEHFHDLFGVDPRFRQHGYLFVTADPARVGVMDAELTLQRSLGVPTERIDASTCARLCPPLRMDDVRAANFCARDGSIDPHTIMQGFLGAFRRAGGALRTSTRVHALGPAPTGSVSRAIWRVETSADPIESAVVVIAAGPHSRQVASLAGIDVPAYPFARQVFVAERPASVPASIPLTVDLDTGWYVHGTRAELLLGGTDKEARPGMEHDVDWALFDNVYAAAVHRMPVLADAKVIRGYAGVRTLSPDHHAILGPAGDNPGLYLACGLSGHGIMHSPAVGMLLAEWITAGAPQSWDARSLGLQRFEQRSTLTESAAF